MTLNIATLCTKCHYADHHYAECRISFIVKLNVVMLSVIMLSAVMMNVVMLNVVAPIFEAGFDGQGVLNNEPSFQL
jgi:hypothetical protein